MELRLLQYFLAVVREENISRAAEALHVTQPTLSRQMAQLEQELGAQLFLRGKKLVLTEAGVRLRRRAEEVVSLLEKMEKEFQAPDELSGVLSIGMGGLASSRFLAEAITRFQEAHPKVQFDLYSNSAEYVYERLEHGLLDFGLLLEPANVTRFAYLRMTDKERWGLFMHSGHPLASRKHILREDLLGEKLMTSPRISIQRELEQWLGCSLSRLDLLGTHNLITNAILLVEQGAAAALTLEGAVDLLCGERFVFRPLFPELAMTSVLAWLPRNNVGTAAAFLAHVKSML